MGSPLSPVLITPFQTGLETDIEPWLAPQDSFSDLVNAHIKHGFVEKRSGHRLFGQMQGFTSTLNIAGISNALTAVVTVAAIGALVNGDRVYISGVVGMTQVNDNIYVVANIAGNTFELSGVDSTLYGVYGGGGIAQIIGDATDRVMGIYRFRTATNTNITLAFNTTKANRWDGVANQFLPLDSAPIMSGTAPYYEDYVWATNWQSSNIVNRLYFTNGKPFDGGTLDGIRYYDNSGTGNTTTAFRPVLGGARILYGCKLIFIIKQRMIVLNTYEFDGASTNNHPQRARWCQSQGPSNWNDIIAGGGGFVDAPTGDQIISARSIKDQIIVFFSNSVWTLRPVPDPALPFRWDKINDFRACDSRMGSIGYDNYVNALGIRGITATDGAQTQRIDDRISNFVGDSIHADRFQKVYCERSYANKRWWTLYPSHTSDESNSALIYDDESKAFSTYDIDLNCLGYGNLSEDYGLNDFIAANELDVNLLEVGDNTIQDYFWQDNQEIFLGGNLVGTVTVLESDGDDLDTSIDSTMTTAQWNPFTKEGKEALMSYVDIYLDTDQKTKLLVEFFKDDDTAPYGSQLIDCLPNLTYVCDIQNMTQTNPCIVNAAEHGFQTGQVVFLYSIIGTGLIPTSFDVLNGGPYSITVIDDDNFSLDGVNATLLTAYLGQGRVFLREFYKAKIWKRVHAGGIGYGHFLRISSEGKDCPFRIHAFKPSFKSLGKRTTN